MRRKKCNRCGRAYDTDKQGSVMCPECAKESRRQNVIRNRECIQCGKIFKGGPRAKYCPECREKRRKKRDLEFKKNGPMRPLGSEDVCQRCGKTYIVEAGTQKYCKDCAEIAVKEVVRPHKREYNMKNKEKIHEYKNKMRKSNKICVICGNSFEYHTSRVTCSEECDKERKKRIQRKADIKRGKLKNTSSE